MTSRERGLAVFHGEIPDRAPVCDFGNAAMLGYTGHTMKECRGNTALTDSIMKEWAKATGADIFFGPMETKGIFMDLPDLQIKLPDDDQGSLQNTYFSSPEDVESKPLYDPFNPEESPNFRKYVLDVFKSERAALPDVMTPAWCEGVLTTSGFLRGIDTLILMLLTEPDEAKKVIRRGADFSRDIVSAQLEEVDADYVVYTDPVSSADMIDDVMFREFNLDLLHRNITHWKNKYGVGTMLHICGDTTPMLKDFAKTGAEVMSLDHKVNLKTAKADFGGKLAVMGNLDPVSLILNGSAADVAAAAEKCFEDAGKDGGYIFGAGCAEPKATPIANIQAMVEVSKKHPY
ncbi:Uroporphyrinogen-III decarboxylase [Thermoplasmatales archaeon BRNA1]|nr:Uroporphyrinogen-III decarboxylase [Thermoplasmatales archaeon BRNA1]